MAEELRSALALSRAREQINKTHLKEIQHENKKLKEQLKDEQALHQRTLHKLASLQQQKNSGGQNSNHANRRASTGANNLANKFVAMDLYKSTGTQTSRMPKLQQQTIRHFETKQHIDSLEKQLEQQQRMNLNNKKLMKEISGNLVILMNALEMFERAVIGPINKDGSFALHPPTVKELTRNAQRERVKYNHQQEKNEAKTSSATTMKQNMQKNNQRNMLPNGADVENMVLSLGDLATEVTRLRTLEANNQFEDDGQMLGVANTGGVKNRNNRSNGNTPTRNEVLASKLRIFQQVSKQKETNYMEEMERMEAKIVRLNDELRDLKQVNKTIEREQKENINTFDAFDMFDAKSMEQSTVRMMNEMSSLRKFCEKHIEMKVHENNNEKKKLSTLLEDFNATNIVTTPKQKDSNNVNINEGDEEKNGKFYLTLAAKCQ
jgi:hypothetical protein